jgi:hypothetical protein
VTTLDRKQLIADIEYERCYWTDCPDANACNTQYYVGRNHALTHMSRACNFLAVKDPDRCLRKDAFIAEARAEASAYAPNPKTGEFAIAYDKGAYAGYWWVLDRIKGDEYNNAGGAS